MSWDPFAELARLQLPVGDHAVFGSGPLIVRGIVPFTQDLDIVCRGAVWEMVRGLGETIRFDDGTEVASLDGGRLTFGTRWMYGEIDVDEVIDTAEIIDGIPFARLEYVERFKLAAGRPKDLMHLRALEEWRDRAAGRPG